MRYGSNCAMAIISYWSALTSIAKVVDKHRRSALQGVHLVVIWSFLAIGCQEDISTLAAVSTG